MLKNGEMVKILFVLAWVWLLITPCRALAKTVYLNSGCLAGCNGTTPALGYATLTTLWGGTADGDTIECVAGSGPYSGRFQPPNSLQNLTMNMHGCEFGQNVNINLTVPATNKWLASADTGAYAGSYYLLKNDDTNPFIGFFDTGSTLTQATVDGDWLAASSNMSADAQPGNSWDWGDHDSLGFSTLYVRWDGGDPTAQSVEILISKDTYSAMIMTLSTGYVINDAVFSGGNTFTMYMGESTTFNRCTFKYADSAGLYHAASTIQLTVNYCKFIDCGHRGIYSGYGGTVNVRNCTFDGPHLAYLKLSANAGTINYYNNDARNLYAGGIDIGGSVIGGAVGVTVNEANNSWQLDQQSVHANQAIGFGTQTASVWPTTSATDFPPSADTTLPCVAVDAPGCGNLQPDISIINAGSVIAGIHNQGSPATDIGGTSVLTIPDIGAYESPGGLYFNAAAADGGNGTRQLPYNAWTDYTWTGYNLRGGAEIYLQGAMGTLDLSSLTDTGAKAVRVWPGKTGSLTGFVGGNDTVDLSGKAAGSVFKGAFQ